MLLLIINPIYILYNGYLLGLNQGLLGGLKQLVVYQKGTSIFRMIIGVMEQRPFLSAVEICGHFSGCCSIFGWVMGTHGLHDTSRLHNNISIQIAKPQQHIHFQHNLHN